MIERDYIMRMIQMLTTALVKVLLQRDLKQYDSALMEIDELGERFLGMKWKFLRSLSDRQLIELLCHESQHDKMLAAAELLREESEILNDQGKAEESIAQGMKAFSLFAELIINEKGFLKVMSVEKFASLLKRIEEYELPMSMEQKRFRYCEIVGKLAKAEDLLFDLIDKDKGFVNEGISFYKRLLKKSDEELLAGGLPRDEVTDGLKKVESLSKSG